MSRLAEKYAIELAVCGFAAQTQLLYVAGKVVLRWLSADLTAGAALTNLANCPQISNPRSTEAEVRELEVQSSAGDFWDDPTRAQVVLQQLAKSKERLQETERLGDLLEDVKTAVDLAALEVDLTLPVRLAMPHLTHLPCIVNACSS